jgi:hypothetical protein
VGNLNRDFRREFAWALWQGGTGLFLLCLLMALAAGLWPEMIFPAGDGEQPVPLRVLQTLAVGQVAFIFLIFPLVMMRRFSRGQVRFPLAHGLAMTAAGLACAAPFYLAAAKLSDASATDVLRTLVLIVLLWPVGWAAGKWMRRPAVGHGGDNVNGDVNVVRNHAYPPAAAPVLILALIAVAGLPALFYVLKEFLPGWPADWLWDLAPVTLAWQVAARGQAPFAGLSWPIFVWLAVAIVADVLSALIAPSGD